MRPPWLIALSPGALDVASAELWLGAARGTFAAGLRGLVLRESLLSDREFLALAAELRRHWPRAEGGWLCVHDRAHLAEAADADAVHLGGDSLSPTQVRGWLKRGVSIGLSTHAEDESRAWEGADYLFHGPVERTTKPGARPPIGFDGLARAVRRAGAPVWALGGLRPEHAPRVFASGAAGLAVLTGIFGAPSPAAAARAYATHGASAPAP